MIDATQIVLATFFLYFVLGSSACTPVLNCKLQRFLNESVWFRHVLIFMSIFVFTFILNWYTFDSLYVGERRSATTETFSDTGAARPPHRSAAAARVDDTLSMIGRWLLLSLVVYLVFIVSTKTDWEYLVAFLVLIVGVVVLQIFIKSVADSRYTDEKLSRVFFLTDAHYAPDRDNHALVQACHTAGAVMYVLMAMLLVVGCVKYAQRQRAEHRAEWHWWTFFFGSSQSCGTKK